MCELALNRQFKRFGSIVSINCSRSPSVRDPEVLLKGRKGVGGGGGGVGVMMGPLFQ